MEFKEAVRTCLTQKYCRFKGRASRAEFWWFSLFTLLLNIVVLLVGAIAPGLVSIISAALGLWLVLPTVSAATRRLHDRNLSGWWQALPVPLALLGPLGTATDNTWVLFAAGVRRLLRVFGFWLFTRLKEPPAPTVLGLIRLTARVPEGHHNRVAPPFGDNRRKPAPAAHCRASCQTFGYSVWPGHHLPY